jgi:hypothetical protein
VTTEAQAVFPQTPRDAEFFIGGYPSKWLLYIFCLFLLV